MILATMHAKEFLWVLNEIYLFDDQIEVEAMLDLNVMDEAKEYQHKDTVELQRLVNTFAQLN